jgi:beta-glucosidase
MDKEEILKNLTLREKAQLLTGKDFWQTRDFVEYGIKPMFLSDGPHGLRKQAAAADHLGLNASIPATCFPTAATMANSWNTSLGEQLGKALGEEAASQNVNVVLGPGICMKRNPRCGRNFEYFSEDPYLAGKLAAAYVRGIQQNGTAACVKHFAANNQEERRMVSDSIIHKSLRRCLMALMFAFIAITFQIKQIIIMLPTRLSIQAQSTDCLIISMVNLNIALLSLKQGLKMFQIIKVMPW